MAMTTRATASSLPKGFTVLILGATTLSGKVAVPLVRKLGAGKIIGVARNTDAMKGLGLDQSIKLETPASNTDFSSALKGIHVDIVLNYLYGDVVIHLFNSLPAIPMEADKWETQYVQIGSMASSEIGLPSAPLRAKNIVVRGSGPGSWSIPQLGREIPNIISTLAEGIGEFNIQERGLDQVTEAFNDTRTRSVFVP